MNTNEPWIDLFLRELRVHGLINTAATAAGVTRRRVDRERETNAEFEYAMDDALEASADVLELEARRRAVEGVEKGVYFQGAEVATEVVYSDTLLTTLLKAKRADEFAERKQITGAGGKPLTVVVRSFGPADVSSSASAPPPAPAGNYVDAEYRRVEPGALPAPEPLADIFDLV